MVKSAFALIAHSRRRLGPRERFRLRRRSAVRVENFPIDRQRGLCNESVTMLRQLPETDAFYDYRRLRRRMAKAGPTTRSQARLPPDGRGSAYNLLTLAKTFKRQPDAATCFFDESLLRRRDCPVRARARRVISGPRRQGRNETQGSPVTLVSIRKTLMCCSSGVPA